MAAYQIHVDDSMGGSVSAATADVKRGKEKVDINLNADLNAESMAMVRWNGEGSEGEDHGFRVGDIVWGKVKGHPWWPGQVYDPSDASPFALKFKQEGRVLVAFFGDGSSSWCLPSQLVPFVENLERMWGESSSKSFTVAVQEALDELSRLVELNSSCNCVQSEKRLRLCRPVATNFGVKADVPVPEVDVARLPIPEFEPSGVLAEVIGLAKRASFDSLFELAMLKSRVSAFSYAKFGVELCRYSDPVVIEGLEDRIIDLNAPKNSPEVDDDPSPKSFSMKTDSQMKKKKKKSVSEIMAKKNAVKSRKRRSGVVKDGGGGASTSGKRMRKQKDEVPETREKSDGATVLKEDVEKSDGAMVLKEDVGDKVDGSENGCAPRKRKKSKYLSSPYITKREPQVDEPGKTTMESEDPDFSAFAFDGNLDEKAEDSKKMAFSASDVDMEVNDVLLKMQSAAVDASYLEREGHLDSIWGFISAFRSSNYVQGSNFKAFNKLKKASHKRKSMSTPSTAKPRRCSSKISSRRKRRAGEPDDLVSEARAIREKLDTMTKTLSSYSSRFSAEAKSCLEDVMKGVMEKVEMANEKVQSMAQNASSPIGHQ